MRTAGDHIRIRRLAVGLTRKDVAEQIGVTEATVFNWEANSTSPNFRVMPAITALLVYNPVPEPETAGERLAWERTSVGLSQ